MSKVNVTLRLEVDEQHRLGAAIASGKYDPETAPVSRSLIAEALERAARGACEAYLADQRLKYLRGVREWTLAELAGSEGSEAS